MDSEKVVQEILALRRESLKARLMVPRSEAARNAEQARLDEVESLQAIFRRVNSG